MISPRFDDIEPSRQGVERLHLDEGAQYAEHSVQAAVSERCLCLNLLPSTLLFFFRVYCYSVFRDFFFMYFMAGFCSEVLISYLHIIWVQSDSVFAILVRLLLSNYIEFN